MDAERAYGIDEEKCLMLRVVHRLPYARNVAGDPGRGFIVRDENGLDRVRLVGLQLLGEDVDGTPSPHSTSTTSTSSP